MARRSRLSKAPQIDHKSENQGSSWNPELVESLYNLLYRLDLGSPGLDEELQRMEAEHHDTVYSELIYLLSHLRFEPGEAREHWRRIMSRREAMQGSLGAPVDLRVALVSYFVEVNRRLKNPKVIELKLFEQTQAFAYRDELSGLCNFRYFREHLVREVERAERYNQPLSLVMIDIDNFKSYNDNNGHEGGNQALVTIAGLLLKSLRKMDVPARYGGEEFALILPSTTKTGAYRVADRIRTRIEQHPFPHEESQPGGQLTVSMGIATHPADATEENELVRRADSAMYFAKTRGKNQVYLYGQNRRSHRRIRAALDGKFSLLAAEYHPLTTINIGEGGLLFLVDRKLPVGSLIDLTLMLPDLDREITSSGRVVRVEEKGRGQFEAAIRLIEIGTEDQQTLARYVQEENPGTDPQRVALVSSRRRGRARS